MTERKADDRSGHGEQLDRVALVSHNESSHKGTAPGAQSAGGVRRPALLTERPVPPDHLQQTAASCRGWELHPDGAACTEPARRQAKFLAAGRKIAKLTAPQPAALTPEMLRTLAGQLLAAAAADERDAAR